MDDVESSSTFGANEIRTRRLASTGDELERCNGSHPKSGTESTDETKREAEAERVRKKPTGLLEVVGARRTELRAFLRCDPLS
jgi:hypothetical protein